ncbi:MAG: folate-binding protein [Anaeromyxobacteraceae bacterium]
MNQAERLGCARVGFAVGPVQQRGFLRASGPDARDFLHRMSTQDLRRLLPGQAAYAAFLTPRGHLLGEGQLLVREADVVISLEPAALEGTHAHLEKLVIMDDVVFDDLSGAWCALPVYGPDALVRLAGRGGDAPCVMTLRRGAACVELWLPAAEAEPLRAALVAGGAVALTDGDLEALRVLGGIPRYGVDMDDTRLPMEAGLTRDAISFEKGCYVGQETVMRATARGHLQRGLVQLSLPPGAARGAALMAAGQEVGVVTSAVDTPEGRVGLGYVRRPFWPEETRLATECGEVVVRRQLVWEPEG